MPELPLRRMRRVEATFMESRNRVVTRRTAGKDENMSGFVDIEGCKEDDEREGNVDCYTHVEYRSWKRKDENR